MYDVVLLVEHELSELDARQVASLHEEVADPVRYHLVLPIGESAARLETSMGTLLGPEFTPPATPLSGDDLNALQHEVEDSARRSLEQSLARLRATGHDADGILTSRDPVEALSGLVAHHGAAEAIVITEPHLLKELFHVDWTSRARRRLDVPTLHLLEHESFDEQAGGAGEGSSIL